MVWRALYAAGIAETAITWNAVQLHPHGADPLSNRTPTPDELELGKPALLILANAFPRARFVAVGRKAEQLLQDAGINAFAAVRHPANGGGALFAEGIAAAARSVP